MRSEKEFVEVFIKNWGNIKKALDEMEIEFWLLTHQKKEEKPTMKATYNGFTGELVKLEKLERMHYGDCRYSISLCDDDKNVTYSFSCVRLEDVKFSGGVMIFGG